MFEHVAALFFDLDGTLVDSVPDLTAAVNAMLQQLGLPERPEARVRTWVGRRLRPAGPPGPPPERPPPRLSPRSLSS